eukprot:PhM_4_TR11470/c0_g1_i1/m.16171
MTATTQFVRHPQTTASTHHLHHSSEYNTNAHRAYSLMQRVRTPLKLSQITLATAMVFYHRFCHREGHSFEDYPAQVVAVTALFLGAKAESNARSLRDILAATFPSETQLARRTEQILHAEMVMIEALGYTFTIPHPYQVVQRMTTGCDTEMRQFCWGLVNDSYYTSMCMSHDATALGLAIVALGAKCHNRQEEVRVHLASLPPDIEASVERELVLHYARTKRQVSNPVLSALVADVVCL